MTFETNMRDSCFMLFLCTILSRSIGGVVIHCRWGWRQRWKSHLARLCTSDLWVRVRLGDMKASWHHPKTALIFQVAKLAKFQSSQKVLVRLTCLHLRICMYTQTASSPRNLRDILTSGDTLTANVVDPPIPCGNVRNIQGLRDKTRRWKNRLQWWVLMKEIL